MFKELDVVVLTAEVPQENIWDALESSPMCKAGHYTARLNPEIPERWCMYRVNAKPLRSNC